MLACALRSISASRCGRAGRTKGTCASRKPACSHPPITRKVVAVVTARLTAAPSSSRRASMAGRGWDMVPAGQKRASACGPLQRPQGRAATGRAAHNPGTGPRARRILPPAAAPPTGQHKRHPLQRQRSARCHGLKRRRCGPVWHGGCQLPGSCPSRRRTLLAPHTLHARFLHSLRRRQDHTTAVSAEPCTKAGKTAAPIGKPPIGKQASLHALACSPAACAGWTAAQTSAPATA